MAVSTTTYAWNNGTIVTAEGTLAEVITEITAGASSSAPLTSRENIIAPPHYNGTNITAVWWSTKNTW